MRFFIAILFLGLSNILRAQSPQIEWQKCFGGSGNERPGSTCMIQLKDSNFVIAGSTDSNDGDVFGNHGLLDYWIVKFDRSGNIIWQKCYGGSIHDGALSVIETIDEGLLICGQASSSDGDVTGNHSVSPYYDIWIIKLDSFGNLVWQKCFGGSGDESAYQIISTFDSAFVFAGKTTSNNGDVSGNHSIDTADFWLVKFNNSGTLLWQKCFGGTREDVAYSVIQTRDSGFAMTGYSLSNDGDIIGNHDTSGNYADFWIVKTDALGNLQWQKSLGGSRYETAWSIIQNSNGDFITLGHTSSNDGDVSGNHNLYFYDVWIVKLSSIGDIIWQKCYGGTNNEYGFSIVKDKSAGFIIGAESFSNDSDVSGNHSLNLVDYWIFGIDSIGNLEWQKCYGGTQNEWISSLIPTLDSGLIACGYTRSNDGDVSGHHLPLTAGDFWIIKLSEPSLGLTSPPNSILDFRYHLDQNNSLSIEFYSLCNQKAKLIMFDITGRIIINFPIDVISGINKREVSTRELKDGVYFFYLETEAGIDVRKSLVIY